MSALFDSRRASKGAAVRRRTTGIPFNILIAGHASTGKTQFLQTLYEALDVKKLHFADPSATAETPFSSTDVQTATPLPARIEFVDDASMTRYLLRLVDSPGLPIPVNIHKQPNADYSKLANLWTDDIIKYIETQYELTLLEESKVKRNPKSPDYQTHVLLYFIDPNVALANKGLTPIDRQALKRLTTRVNIIPVIGKADLLSKKQVKLCREYIMKDIEDSDLKVFGYAQDPDTEYDEETLESVKEIKESLPYTVINSEMMDDGRVGITCSVSDPETDTVTEEVILGREYPWGIVQTENPDHCDFVQLKTVLFASHADELKTLTRELYYEQWRTEKLMEVRGSVISSARGTLEHPFRSHSLTPPTPGTHSASNSIDRLTEAVKKKSPNNNIVGTA